MLTQSYCRLTECGMTVDVYMGCGTLRALFDVIENHRDRCWLYKKQCARPIFKALEMNRYILVTFSSCRCHRRYLL